MDSIMDISAVESKLSDVSITAIPMSSSALNSHRPNTNGSLNLSITSNTNGHSPSSSSVLSQFAAQMPQIQISAVQNLTVTPSQQISPIIAATQGLSARNFNDLIAPMTQSIQGMPNIHGLTKYGQLLAIIEEMGREIRPTYTGSRSSTERLKRGIVHARILVRECLMETERRN